MEYRNGMMNISPIGRNCTKDERNAFDDYDKTAKVRETFIKALETELGDLNL